MKKVTAFVGSAHKKNTHKAVEQYLNNLKALGEVESEIVTLTDHNLGICRGCRLCFMKGEQYCPLKDDRDILFEKIEASDGVIFAMPNYCFQMSGSMKVFLDRFGFAIHRPRYFGKVFTSIISQGFARGDRIQQDIDFTASLLGFTTVKGAIVTGFDPMSEKQRRKADKNLKESSKRFHAQLSKPADSEPSLFQVLGFRIGRSMIRLESDKNSVDYQYYEERDWLSSAYYYPTRLNLFKSAAGNLVDTFMGTMRSLTA